MRVGVVGVNHKTADLAVREAVARGAQSLAGQKKLFFRHPTVLLSTCNRTEIYFSASDLAEAHNDLLELLRQQIERPFEQHLYSFFGLDCFTHLCRVTAGLDSAIFAETEIQRQVKIAYADSCAVFALPSCIHYVFQKSLHISKHVRSFFSSEQGTLFAALWRLMSEAFPEVLQKRVLLVGYSEINRRFRAFLEHRGLSDVTFCTRATRAWGRGREELARWNDYDLICCATQADGYLVQGQGNKRHLIFDLSVPRNVDPEVGKSTTLYNIEQINHLIEQKAPYSLEQGEAMIEEHAARLSTLYCEKKAGRWRGFELVIQ